MDRMTIDARCVDTGLGKLIAAFVIALIDEDLVIDSAGNDGELGAGDVFRGELGILFGRGLSVACADGDVDRHLCEPGFVHAESLDDAGRHGERSFDAGIVHREGERRIERQLLAEILGNRLIVAPALLEGEVLVGVDFGAADPQRGEAALRMPGDADAVGIDRLAPNGIA